MSSNFLTSFSICHQMLRFKLEHRLLFRKVALNGGSDPTPSFSEHMFLFHPTSCIVLPLSSFSFLILLSLQTLYSFPFSSPLPNYIHHLFYFIVHFCFHSFTADSPLSLLPSNGHHFSKSVVKWACQWRCVLEEGKQRKYSVFFPISYFPLSIIWAPAVKKDTFANYHVPRF